MLLTLTARSLAPRLGARGPMAVSMAELPRFVFQQTALRGLAVDTSLLKGWGLDRLESLRTQADQAGCPCLLLRESFPVASGHAPGGHFDEAMKRVDLVARAAHRLGCNALALQPDCPGAQADDRAFDFHVAFYRRLIERLDRLEVNVLIEPAAGWLGTPQWHVELVKKVGGFRIGTLPTFEAACRTPDCVAALRQTAPYAGAVLASFSNHDVPEAVLDAAAPADDETSDEKPGRTTKKKTVRKGASASATATATRSRKKTARKPKAEDSPPPPSRFLDCVKALGAVGYEQILALDYLGSGDSVAAVNAARKQIETSLEAT